MQYATVLPATAATPAPIVSGSNQLLHTTQTQPLNQQATNDRIKRTACQPVLSGQDKNRCAQCRVPSSLALLLLLLHCACGGRCVRYG